MKCSRLIVFIALFLAACSLHKEVTSDLEPSERERPQRHGSVGPSGPDILIGHPPAKGTPTLSSLPGLANPVAKLLMVVDTPYEIFDGQGTYVHVAVWTLEGKPAANATVYVGEEAYGRTNEQGSFVFLYPSRSSGRTSAIGAEQIVAVAAGDDSLRAELEFYPQMRTESFARDHLYVYTDRGVYRPGERIHMRMIAWHLKDDYRAVENARVDFLLYGPGRKVVSGGRVTTDSFGVAAVDIPLAETAPAGNYTLEISYGTATESARLQVRQFEPPIMEISHDLPRFLTPFQESLETTLHLKPTTGGDVEQATVQVELQTPRSFALSHTTIVKGNGPHRLGFSRKELQQLYDVLSEGDVLTAVITIADAKGREGEVQRAMRYTRNPYVGVLETERMEYSAGEAVRILAKLSDLDGVPASNVAVVLEFNDTIVKATTDARGVAHFKATMPEEDVRAALVIDGVDEPLDATNLAEVPVQPMRSTLDAPTLEEGKTARVVVHFPDDVRPVSPVVHLDIVDTSGAIVNAILLPIETIDGKPVASGEFTVPSWGSMLLTFFALGTLEETLPEEDRHLHLGLLTEGQDLVVYPNKTLTITLEDFAPLAIPGSALKANARVTDAQGRPVEASIGAAIVDGRVISLQDPLELTPMDKLYNPILRTMATTGSQILTWPVVSRNWGEGTYDLALPPFSFHEGGELDIVYSARTEEDELEAGAEATSKSQGVGGMGLSGTGAGGGGYGMGGFGRGSGGPPAIRIRTDFRATSFWDPHLRTGPDGLGRLEAILPDLITEQEIILVASDRNGGVGILRERVKVTTDFHLVVDPPAMLITAEATAVPVFVENHGLDPLFEGTLDVASEGLEISPATQPLSLGKGGSTGRVVHVTAPRAGAYTLKVTARDAAGTVIDAVERTLLADPPGTPVEATTTKVLMAEQGFEHTWTIEATSAGNEAFLSVVFPAVTTAFLGAEALARTVAENPLSLASDLVGAALLLQYADKQSIESPAIDDLRRRVTSAVHYLYDRSLSGGAYTYWRSGEPSPFVTAWVLDGLIEAGRAGVDVDEATLRRSATWLAMAVDEDFGVGLDDIAFWEGSRDAQRLGLLATIYDVLTRLPENARTEPVGATQKRLEVYFQAYLQDSSVLDPLATGLALSALLYTKSIGPDDARRVIGLILERRDRGHWEPSWFHAYGGRIEATVAVLAALNALDPTGFVAERRDALNYILSTRSSFGHWHNDRGTAQAIRAILLTAPDAPEEGLAMVTIRIDGRVLYSGDVDPADPFGSTAFLSHVSLGRHLPPGEHTVEVTYTGRLAPTIAVTTRSWEGVVVP